MLDGYSYGKLEGGMSNHFCDSSVLLIIQLDALELCVVTEQLHRSLGRDNAIVRRLAPERVALILLHFGKTRTGRRDN
jgi:hypothetical protein